MLLGGQPGALLTIAQNGGPLLLAVALPALGSARGRAEEAKFNANLRAVGQGIHVYAANNNEQRPPDLGTLA